MSPFLLDGAPDARGLLLCQQPTARSRIMPLFSFDPRNPDERPLGHGTAFRIDPWGTCATAFHVVEDLLRPVGEGAELREDMRLSALEFEGIGYGRVRMPEGAWRPFLSMGSFCRLERQPFEKTRIRNVTELAALAISRSPSARGNMPYLSVDFRRWRPQVGERVTAFGFADLDVDRRDEGDARAMHQYLYASSAVITEVQGPDGASTRPWPIFRVEAEWPGGMSGGPVFNAEEHVVGLVSTGLVGAGIGTATFFSGWDLAERTFPTLDPSNPGWLRGWGGFDAEGTLAAFAPIREPLDTEARTGNFEEICRVTSNPATGDYMRL